MKIVKRLLIGILVLLVVLGLVISLSSYPVSLAIRKLFDGGVAVAPSNFEDIKKTVAIQEDLEYPSNNKSNTFDLFSPLEYDDSTKTIIWVHGGAFVGGDKHDIYEYAIQIASHGYHVVSMNYERAPEASYPTPLNQLSELSNYLIEDNSLGIKVDQNNMIYAGDSAGAHIVSQFALIQNDSEYANLTGIKPTLKKYSILGLLLYCGPYDINSLVERANESKILDFFAGKIGWAYTGERKWKDSKVLDSLSIIDYVSESFPSSFITDGNNGSFTEHGIALSEKLKSMNVTVSDKFYDIETEKLDHEYQFRMDLKSSVETFEATIDFLNNLKSEG